MEGERFTFQTQVETEAERAGSLAAGPDRSTAGARGWREGCRGISTAASQWAKLSHRPGRREGPSPPPQGGLFKDC